MSATSLPIKIGETERLARFLTQRSWIRGDGTIRQNAFMPPNDLNFSVTRTLGLDEKEIWEIGQKVVDEIAKESHSLQGRAEVTVPQVKQAKLAAVSFPLTTNHAHAHIEGWPADKDSQKIIALELAALAGKAIRPPAGHGIQF